MRLVGRHEVLLNISLGFDIINTRAFRHTSAPPTPRLAVKSIPLMVPRQSGS